MLAMRRERLDHTFFEREVRPRIGSLLLEKGLLNREQLDQALAERSQVGGLLGETLVRLGFIFEDELARVLAQQAGAPFVDLDAVSVDRHAAATLPRQLGEELCALPVRFLNDGGIVVAVANPVDAGLVPQLRTAITCPIEIAVATASSIRRSWRAVATA